ncbi:MAG: peptidoglycan DD-metalloendopeptidase family protein [Flavobacteriaceae bacterium]|nr:peptidoglycan DD-metalloendopeptidase family protein [Muriicola sp.]MBT8289395.1 peptidoglycan DD-metalloendopeptidase family protein [Muriicola sp.]NNC62632.1 peptidoglycan DD-metalloendopeptidase family protein [Eudoraea sp.]NNK34588.1 peptidoglycan DD-metalloendopeptidase family protein [Eudoraea sp.]NNL38952.1 peptidoglycan DD-metalloendopeptidase family protein [Flavobacteriaceae bacterium]
MADFTHILSSIQPGPLLDASIPFREYTPLDLSVDNKELQGIDLSDPLACQEYINTVLAGNKARVAYGGYLERRNLYSGNAAFSEGEERRDVHLGVDFWAEAGTAVLAPIEGEVHSFKNNAVKGDYGPTIILRHKTKGVVFHSLYGHLSLECLDGLYEGKRFKNGEVLATLGTSEENVNYAPHLHFQLIFDLQGMQGDYPGVCRASEKGFYRANCPDPNHLFSL